MKFCVCIKQVPDVLAPMQIRDGKLIQDTGRMVLNAYDASAVEAALVLTEPDQGEVEVVLIGPESARETVRKALAMGAERGTLIQVSEDASLDSEAFARVLAAFLQRHPADVVLCGKQAQDTDAGLTGSMLAALLDLPYATNAIGVERSASDDGILVTRQGDAGQEIIELPLPCLITCSNDMNDPRIPNLKGIMQSKKKPIQNISASELGIQIPSLEENAVRITGFETTPERQPGKILDGNPEEAAESLVEALRQEARVF